MAAFNLQPEQQLSLDSDDCDKAIRREKLRLKHIIIEEHRTKAKLARLVAKKEDNKADRLADAIGEPTVKVTQDDSPAILRLDLAKSLRGSDTDQSKRVVTQPPIDRKNRKPPQAEKFDTAFIPTVSIAAKSQPLRKPPSRQRPFSWRRSPPWFWSVLVHAAVLLLATMATFATLPNAPVFLTADAPHGEEDVIPQLAEFELEPIQPNESQVEELPGEVSEFESVDFSTEDFADPFEAEESSLLDTPAKVDLLTSDLGTLMAGVPAEGSEGGASAGGLSGAKAAEASFFGAKSQGNRFVFLVDNSGSMVEGRMETTLMELQRSVEALKEDQFFSIIFYSDQVYPLFYPESVEELVPATRENKQQVAKWLPTVEMCLGGRLREAMDLVQKLDPQVVYLLSDGDIRSEPLMRHLTEANDWKFVIHTFGMTVRNPDHLAKLSAIAMSHQGQFVPVRVHPAAAQMARQRPIKYHREPGTVWGTKVRPWN